MARDGLSLLLCAGMWLGACTGRPLVAGEDADNRLAVTLAVQTALQQGRDHLRRGHYQAAVYVLESQIARIDGSREYLTALRDAYRGHIKELRLAKRDPEAALYLRRLQILDPGATLDLGEPTAKAPPQEKKPEEKKPVEPPQDKVRAHRDLVKPAVGEKTLPQTAVPDVFDDRNRARPNEAQTLLERAEREFRAARYGEAGALYSQASRLEAIAGPARERWAYCRLHSVVERLNKAEKDLPADELSTLEQEVKATIELTPKLSSYGKDLLVSIQGRRTVEPAAARVEEPAAAAVAVQHRRQPGSAWLVAESANFRIFHTSEQAYAEKVAQVAEASRLAMQKKWFGRTSEDWSPRCDIYLHATADAYSRATGVPSNSPGHSTMQSEGPRLLARRIDLHVDDINLLGAVLPHETTHVVLAGRFGPRAVPRWADEGMAVLTEPRDKVERHLKNLPRHQAERQIFSCRELMALDEYPEPRLIGAFYAQSVSVVDFLCGQRGPQVFSAFLADGMQTGYEPALKKHYGFQGFAELDARWRTHAFREPAAMAPR